MHIELMTIRRALLMTYQSYLEADRAWDIAMHDVNTWFPGENRTGILAIGNPGSPVARLYVQRKRALQQLEAVSRKLQRAKKRLASRRPETKKLEPLFIGHVQP